MKRTFTVGTVAFVADDSQLAYCPTRGARRYQAYGALALSVVCGLAALLVVRYRPFGELIDQPREWNDAVVGSLLLFSICLLAVIPLYLRRAAEMHIVDANPKSLRLGSRQLLDLRDATAIATKRDTNGGTVQPFWVVEAVSGNKRQRFPLLNFSQPEEAARVAEQIGSHLDIRVTCSL